MSKSIVFISHISDEREIAIAFRDLVEASFLGLIDVFVSSDEHSISLGQKWLDNITNALKNCSVEIILCSPKSVGRPWINFEAGSAWIRDIPVIPLCHSGMKPSDLPVPLNLLQAASASEISSLKLIFPVLAGAIGSQVPKVDFSEFVEKVKEFEINYTFWDEVNKHFNYLKSRDSQVINLLKQNQVISCQLKESEINLWNSWATFFRSKNILDFRQIGGTLINENSTFYNCEIRRLAEFLRVVNDQNFKL